MTPPSRPGNRTQDQIKHTHTHTQVLLQLDRYLKLRSLRTIDLMRRRDINTGFTDLSVVGGGGGQ